MLKYIKNHLETIDGIAIYPLVALLLFFVFFIGLIYWLSKQQNNRIEALKNIPFNTTNEFKDK